MMTNRSSWEDDAAATQEDAETQKDTCPLIESRIPSSMNIGLTWASMNVQVHSAGLRESSRGRW
jgi:hypothetical protein